MDSKGHTISKLFVELRVVLLLPGSFGERSKALCHQILLDDTQHLVLWQRVSRDVRRKIFQVDDAYNKI